MSRVRASALLRAAALPTLVLVGGVFFGCKAATEVELWVDGFDPTDVRFEVEEQGALDRNALRALTRRKDIDGSLLLPEGACGGPCRVAVVSVFVRNAGDAEAPPVVRLKSPPGRPARLPIAFRGGEISKGRVGRIRWVVELWPEEERVTTTVSSSVFLVEPPSSADAPPAPSPPDLPTTAAAVASPSSAVAQPAPAPPSHPR